ncbi:uncharacterized protein LOC113852222 [Abrus precatorius]|uniref:Uncharacterized protein LOC113852222 n=1 Tax=Abrus precatorius TaxID=3816 RepID=A0A8B8K3M1_ABRPR|nr:uncharacterized protein LOC113852222 [Abrus precatorius]
MRKAKKAESSNAASSERRNWGNIFNSLVQMVRNQQNQLQSFAKSHKFLEDRMRMQHLGWTSDVRIHKDQISQMKGILIFEEKKQLLEAAKADLTLGFKQREASMLKLILEHTEDELADFKAWFEYLSQKSSNGEDQGTVSKDTDLKKEGTADSGRKSSWNSADKNKCSSEIKDELRRLKGEYEKLALEKCSEVSALLAEKKFVWNQYNMMDSDYSNKLRTKQADLEKANEKIKVLVSSMEQLQSEKNEKDSKISELESKVADMEAETTRLNKEISGLSAELESLRRLRNDQVTPVLNHCTEKAKTSDLGNTKSIRTRRNMNLNKEICTPDAPAPAKSSEKGTKSLKRKEVPAEIPTSETSKLFSSSFKGTKNLNREVRAVIPTSETPKLFSSSFKVPKLKPSLRVR